MKTIIPALLFLLFTVFQNRSLAQAVRLVNSTDQGWSGGVAGSSGHRYTFTLEFACRQNDIMPDTIWIGNEPVLLSLATPMQQGNMRLKKTRNIKAAMFEINAGTWANEYKTILPPGNETEKKQAPLHPPVPYKGVALLSYGYKGARHYYTIGRIMKTYPPINYP